jgi:hypothetical protein
MQREDRKVNWEKISVYIACLGFIYMFWQSQDKIKEGISDIRERIAVLEIKVKKLEEKK